MRITAIALALLCLACSDEGVTATSVPVDVHVTGFRAPGPVHVRMRSVDVAIDGLWVTAELDLSHIDLGQEDELWKVTTFNLPDYALMVDLVIEFWPRGVVERDGAEEDFTFRGPPIRFRLDAKKLWDQQKVVLDFDLARSLTYHEGRLVLIPQVFVK